MAVYRLRRYRPAEACFVAFAAVLVGSLGTGLGLAAAKLQEGSDGPRAPIHKIVRPLENSPSVLNRDRTLLDR